MRDSSRLPLASSSACSYVCIPTHHTYTEIDQLGLVAYASTQDTEEIQFLSTGQLPDLHKEPCASQGYTGRPCALGFYRCDETP